MARKTEKGGKLRNVLCRTWNMARKLKIMENEKQLLDDLKNDMAEMTITVKIEDLPEFKARLARIKKIMRRRAWVNGHRTGKARKSTWKRA